ncbi:MAG: T9SS type A sorting domain-containing protein [Parafilimonas sp.]
MKLYFTICSVFFFLMLQAQQINKAGTLDKSFGVDGKVLTSSDLYPLQCTAVSLQSDGSIIATGSTIEMSFFAMKYSAEGFIDSSFGIKGIASIDGMGEAYTMAIQPDDKILVAGYYAEMFEPYNVSIARFNADGTPDLSFGQNGKVLSSLGDRATAIGLQQDGKILITGAHKGMALIMRFLENGMPDITFGTNGVVENFFGSGTCVGNTIAVQPDGKIVIGGQANQLLFFGRYNTDGNLDESFGSSGKILYDFGTGTDAISDLVLQTDGKIVAVGSSNSYYNDTANSIILRCLPDGSLDKNFGNSGLNNINLGTSRVRSLVLQQDGKIVIGGSGSVNADIGGFLVGRYTTNGMPDSAFGNNGFQTTTFDSVNVGYSVFLAKDGKIVLGGAANAKIVSKPSDISIAIARYNNDDASKKQIIITKIKRWLQHQNGFTWDYNNNASSYVVQRSYDGIHFSSVARINAGNSSNTYNDPSPLSGNNYYRLQTTSTNGALNYSNVIAVSANEDAVKISPNPAKNNLHIEGLSSFTKTKLTVVDFTGNITISQQLPANSATSYNLNIAALKPGNYLLKIEINNDVVTKKFVKE